MSLRPILPCGSQHRFYWFLCPLPNPHFSTIAPDFAPQLLRGFSLSNLTHPLSLQTYLNHDKPPLSFYPPPSLIPPKAHRPTQTIMPRQRSMGGGRSAPSRPTVPARSSTTTGHSQQQTRPAATYAAPPAAAAQAPTPAASSAGPGLFGQMASTAAYVPLPPPSPFFISPGPFPSPPAPLRHRHPGGCQVATRKHEETVETDSS